MSIAIRAVIFAALLCLGLPLATADERSPDVRKVPTSVAADCSRDVSRQLTRWFRSLPDGVVARFPERACYRIETEVVLRNKRDFVLDGQNATLRRTQYTPPERRYPNANAMLRVANLVDSRIENLRIKGTNTKSDLSYLPKGVGSWRQEVEFDAGLGLHGLLRTTVSNVTIKAVWGDGVYLAGSDNWAHRNSEDVVLRRITVYKNGRQGIAINRSHHILLDRVNVRLSRRSAIDLEPDTARENIHHIEVRNSRLGANLITISAWGAGRVNDVNVHDNVIWRTGVPWVYVESYEGLRRRNWTIRNNVVTFGLGSPAPAIEFANTRGIVIDGNHMRLATTQSQLAVGLFKGSGDAVITCNVFLGAKAQFVEVDGAASVTKARNRLTPEPTGCPITAKVERVAKQLGVPRLSRGERAPIVQFAREKLGLTNKKTLFDMEMQVAVQRLQDAHGWPATGVIDGKEWRVLLKRSGPAVP